MYLDRALRAYGLHRVGEQVREHLVQLRTVAGDDDRRCRQLHLDAHLPGQGRAGEVADIGENVLQHERLGTGDPAG